jgi:hypothetical protein
MLKIPRINVSPQNLSYLVQLLRMYRLGRLMYRVVNEGNILMREDILLDKPQSALPAS